MDKDSSERMHRLNKARTKSVVVIVRTTMATIERECDENGGMYVRSRGRLSQAEFCRRAGISISTLQGEHHRNTTRLEVNAWLADLRTRLKTGRKAVRAEVTDRIAPLKDHIAKLVAECTKAQLENASLRSVNARLREALARANELLKSSNLDVIPDP